MPNTLRLDDLKRRAAGVYARIVGRYSREAVACSVGVSPCRMSRWTGGEDATRLHQLAEQVWGMESHGHDTEEVFTFLRSVQAQARVANLADDDLVDAWWEVNEAEQQHEGAQNAAQTLMGRTRDVDAVCRATAAEMAEEARLLAIGYEIQARRLDPVTGGRL